MSVMHDTGAAPTLAECHLAVERSHERTGAFARWCADRWQETPDWRFHRQIIRIALYMKERAGVGAGDHVAIVSTMRPEVLVAEWATMLQGATSVVVDPAADARTFASLFEDRAPRVAFVSEAAALGRLADGAAGVRPEHVVLLDGFDGGGSARSHPTWPEVLDLGGTLDTAERAQALRAVAGRISPEATALAGTLGRDCAPDVARITHAQGGALVARRRRRSAARKGDTAYVAPGALSVRDRLSLHAFACDGYTTIVLGTPGREDAEIAATRPRHVLGARSPSAGAVRSEGGDP